MSVLANTQLVLPYPTNTEPLVRDFEADTLTTIHGEIPLSTIKHSDNVEVEDLGDGWWSIHPKKTQVQILISKESRRPQYTWGSF
jgi:hypothetical protein